MQEGAAGRHRETIQPVGISSFPVVTNNSYSDSNTPEHLFFNKAVFTSAH